MLSHTHLPCSWVPHRPCPPLPTAAEGRSLRALVQPFSEFTGADFEVKG